MYTPNSSAIEKLVSEGYPKRIIGNGGYIATLVDMQPLNKWEHLGIYRYPGGVCVHDLEEAKSFSQFHEEIVVQLYNPIRDDFTGDEVNYVSLWFSDSDTISSGCDSCIRYKLYDSNKNEVNGGVYEYHSDTDYWTIENAIDAVIKFSLDETGKAYTPVSYDVCDFEESCEYHML